MLLSALEVYTWQLARTLDKGDNLGTPNMQHRVYASTDLENTVFLTEDRVKGT